MKNRIFVSGTNGFQGRPITQLFMEKGNEVTTISPSAEKDELGENLKVYAGDFSSKEALQKALSGVEKAIFTLPLVFDIQTAKDFTTNFISTAEQEKVELVVFNSSFDLPQQETGMIALDLKFEVAQLFKASKLKVITIMPDIYIDNLAAPWSIPVIMEQGILPYPVQVGEKIPWISHTDLAKYAVSAADHPELAGQTLPIGGNLLSGEEIAAAVAEKVGKPINFIGLTPNDFEQQLVGSFGEVAAKEISNLYRYVQDNLGALQSKDFESTNKILGINPQTVQEWVDSVQWTN
jgi:uncharacterized protein YbjT (DUF2867 family)